MKYHAIILTSIVIISAVLLTTCKDDDPSDTPVKFQGIVFTDEVGNSLGTYGGEDDNDWKSDSVWTQEILDIMSFQDTVDLSGTYLNQTFAAEEIQFNFFPNPVASVTSARIEMPGRLKVKMAMVDEKLNIVQTFAYKDQDISWVFLDFSDTARFVEGEVYRMYYTFSVEGNENFYKGHGDVLMCYQRPANLCLGYLEGGVFIKMLPQYPD
jgi:hypothetical protein